MATARLDNDRRKVELTPRFRLACASWGPGSDNLRLVVHLMGPGELERLAR